MIPLNFPPSGTVRYYFDKWNEDGTLLEIHDTFQRMLRYVAWPFGRERPYTRKQEHWHNEHRLLKESPVASEIH